MQTHKFSHTHARNKVLKKLKRKARGQANCTSLAEIIVQSLYPYNTSHQQGTLEMACVYCTTTATPPEVMVGPYRVIREPSYGSLVLFTPGYRGI